MKDWQIGDDVLDTRDIDAKIEELEDLQIQFEGCRQAYEEVMEDLDSFEADEFDNARHHWLEAQEDFSAAEREELQALLDFKADLEDYCDWGYGEFMIHENYRVDYTRSLASDIGAVGENADWIQIDWKATADELFRYDYTSADLQGHTYYVRMS